MKILSLKFKNINSLKGEHEIDFTDSHFTQNPLFAITGPTGSGKTTILDVVTLALFGEVPRLGKISKRSVEESGAILTRGQKEAFAQVDYECKYGIYTSVWSIGINRNGNLNDYEMELSRIDQPESLDLRKSQVPRKNEELIGLNYSQFAKSVMLAQGQFAEFLKADRKERSEILEKITGTGIYKQLGRLAFEKFRDKNKSIEEQISILNSEKEKLLSAENREEIEAQLKELIKNKTEDVEKLEIVKKQLELQLEILGLTNTLEKKSKSLELKEKKEKDFEKLNGQIIKNHENVQKYSENLHQWKYKQKELLGLKKDSRNWNNQKEAQQKQNDILFNDTQKFIGRNFDESQTLIELQKFREQVGSLLNQKNELGQKFREKRALFSGEFKVLDLKESVKDLIKDENLWKEVLSQHKNVEESLKKYFENNFPEDISQEIEKKERQSDLLKKAQNDQINLLRIGKGVEGGKERLKTLNEGLEPLPQLIKNLKIKQDLASEKLKSLRLEQKLSLMQAELKTYRSELESGNSCPLCGSKEHPYAEHLPEEKNNLKTQISLGEKEEKTLSDKLSQRSTQQEELTKQKTVLEKEIQKEVSELQQLEETFKSTYPGKFDFKEKDWELHLKLIQDNIEKLKQLLEFEKHNSAIQHAIPLYDIIQNIMLEGTKLSKQIEKLYTGENFEKDIRDFENTWNVSLQKLTSIKERIRETAEKNKKEEKIFTEIKNILLPQLKSIGFTEISQAEVALLPMDKYENLKKRLSEFKEQIKVLQTEIKTHSERKDELSKRLNTTQSSEELITVRDNLDKKLKNVQKQEAEYNRLLKNDEDLIKLINKRKEKIALEQAQILRWKLLRDLIGDANGHKFNQFAQDLTLRQLLILANKRLKEISERYTLVLQPISDAGKDSLVIADMDMGGQERAVQTLSGGESFLVSLALALGLSDLASKNIIINSLFIDEGFGTLDGNTLDQTLDVLERLQASSSKLIGIISHVDSLKERIGTQIQLQQDGQGYSSLKII